MFSFSDVRQPRLVPASILLAGVIGLWANATSQAQAAASAYQNDGRWSIEVITDNGGCDRAYRYSVLIEKGEARYGGAEPIVISGKVASNGGVRGTITYGDNRANVAGKLAEGGGSGHWTWAGSRTCSGHWNAERRG